MFELAAADRVHRVQDACTNWYVIEDDGALTIVDTGHPRSWASLEEVLRQLGRDASAIEAVVLTHAHFDPWASPSGHARSWVCASSHTSASCR